MAQLFYLPFNPVFNSRGLPTGAAKAYFFYTGTTDLAPIYSDGGLATRAANPATADALGQLPQLYLDETITYRLRVVDKNDQQLGADYDPYIPGKEMKGDPGAANNTYSSYTALLASDPTRQYAYLVGDTDNPPRPDGTYTNPTQQSGAWVERSAAANVSPTAVATGGGLDILSTQIIDGQSVPPLRGNVKAFNLAVVGANNITNNPTLDGSASPWTLTNIAASSPGATHIAGSAASIKQTIPVTLNETYLIKVTLQTTTAGGFAFNVAGAPVLDMGEYHATPIGTDTYQFSYSSRETEGPVPFEWFSDTVWAGKVISIRVFLVEQIMPQDFVSIPADGKNIAKANGIKFGPKLTGEIYMGDRETGGLASQGTAWNIGIGDRALSSNTTAQENTAVGTFALQYNQVEHNTAGGYSSLKYNTKGLRNTGWGYKTFFRNTCGSDNTGVGHHASFYNTLGNSNTSSGQQALYYNQTGNFNVAIGYQSGLNAGGDSNFYGGAINGPIAAGTERLVYSFQVAAGAEAKTYGQRVIAIGFQAQVGSDPSAGGTAATASIAIGAGSRSPAVESVVIGDSAAVVGLGSIRSTVIGKDAQGIGPQATTVGFLSSGADFSANVGAQSGRGANGVRVSTLGYNGNTYASPNTWNDITAIGAGAVVTAPNQVQLGAPASTTYAYGAVQDRSDRRDKDDIRDTVLGLDFINKLRPVDFRWNMRDDYREPAPAPFSEPRPDKADDVPAWEDRAASYDRDVIQPWRERNTWEAISARRQADGSKKRQRYHHGFEAQQVEELIANTGVDFGGYQNHALCGGADIKSLGYVEFIAPTVKAVQEVDEKLENLSALVVDLTARLAALEAKS